MSVLTIALDKIDPDPEQPRKEFPAEHIKSLAASIKANGLMQPITVRPNGRRFYIVAGECRWRAHKLLKADTIEAIVRDPPTTVDLRVRQAVENISRADLTVLEEARAFRQLSELGLTDEEIAERLGVTLGRVQTRLSLLALEPSIRQLLESGQIEKGYAIEIAKLTGHVDQMRIMHMIRRGEITTWHAVRKAVDTVLGKVDQVSMFGDLPPEPSEDEIATINAMEQKIERVARMLSSGWKDGECIVAAKVSRERATLMAEKITAIRSSLRHMENELRHVTAQARIALVA